MKVPLSWLREFVDVTVEPRRLADDLTAAGLAVDGVETDGADSVLDLDITTNRVDCMNVYGMAREVSVLYRMPLRLPDLSFTATGEPADQALDVVIEAPDLCPRFCARVLEVRLGEAPPWMRERLELVGVRPINNVVDLTNYVMMEMGHPSHAFDLARIPGHRLLVRWAREGERLVTLDGVSRTLHPRLGVVASSPEPLALAGIMGGASSEVSGETRVVALEAAWWDPLSIRRGARSLGMHTEASHRFERGADPEAPPLATARIAHLLERIGAGRTRPGLIDRHPAPRPSRTIALRPARSRALLGAPVSDEDAGRVLRGLGFTVSTAEDHMAVTVPTWRGDVAREVDLVEEVGRHYGLDRIPATVPAATGAEGLREGQVRERRLRDVLTGLGLTEVITHAFVAEAARQAHGPASVRIANPLSEEQNALRTSLVLPGLLAALAVNVRHGRADVRVFEIGRVFLPDDAAVRETRNVGVLCAGPLPSHWSAKGSAIDVFDVAGFLEALSVRLGHPPPALEPGSAPAFLHPGRGGLVRHAGQAIGWVGALHPDVVARWDLKMPVYAAEVALDALLAPPAAMRAQPLPRFPEVARDLSLVCGEDVPAATLRESVQRAAGPLLRAVEVTDRYQGPPVPEGKVSLLLSLRFQHPERTLTGDEVQAAVERATAELARQGAVIRSEGSQ